MNTIKLAFVTEDGETISAHFGRAPKVVVITLENGQEIEREVRDKTTGGHGHHDRHFEHVAFYGSDINRQHEQESPQHDHDRMLESMRDCNTLVARGMGEPAMIKAENAGLEVLLVAEKSIDSALQAYLAGTLKHDPRRLHNH